MAMSAIGVSQPGDCCLPGTAVRHETLDARADTDRARLADAGISLVGRAVAVVVLPVAGLAVGIRNARLRVGHRRAHRVDGDGVDRWRVHRRWWWGVGITTRRGACARNKTDDGQRG